MLKVPFCPDDARKEPMTRKKSSAERAAPSRPAQRLIFSSRRPYIPAAMPLSPVATFSRCRFLPLPLSPVATFSRCHFLPMPLSPVATFSRCHFLPMPLSPDATSATPSAVSIYEYYVINATPPACPTCRIYSNLSNICRLSTE